MKNIVCFIKGRAIIDYTARTHSLWNRARVLGASAALLLVITLASNALAQWCPEPPAGQAFEDFYHPFVRVYTGTNFTGICHMLGRTLTIANLGAPRDQFHQSLTLATNFNNQIRYASGCSTALISLVLGSGGRLHRRTSVGGTGGLRLSASKIVPSSRTAAISPSIRLPSTRIAISTAIAESSPPAATMVRRRWASRTIVSRRSAITPGRSISIPRHTIVLSRPVFWGYPASRTKGWKASSSKGRTSPM
jgi:hypothetical protein